MESQQITGIKHYPITYFSWNKYTILLFVAIVIGLIVSIVIVQLMVLDDYYDHLRICQPIYYYVGNRSCRKFIKKIVEKAHKRNNEYRKRMSNTEIINSIIEKDTFQASNSTGELVIETPNAWGVVTSNFNRFKETVNNNYLAMVKLIHSLIELVWRVIFNELRKMRKSPERIA